MILFPPFTLSTVSSATRRQTDNKDSDKIPLVLLRLITDLDPERFIWEKIGETKASCGGYFSESSF